MKQLSALFRRMLGFPFPISGAFALCLLLPASCGGDDSSDEGYAAIESASFTFDETTPANNAVRVIADTGWQVFWTPESAAVRVDPASGSGNGTFYVRDMPKGTSVQVGVRAASGKTSGKTITVTRAETVFSLDFGDGAGGVWAGANQEWKTQTGTGASTVTYAVNNVRINNDNYGSAGKYAGASGKAYAKMFYDASTDYFVIQDITLPAGQTDFTLAFGTIFPSDDVSLTVSADGAVWRPLAYTGASVYNTWTGTTVGFTLAQPVPKLWIRLAPTGTERTYGLNFDDIVLTTGGGGQQVDLGTGAGLRWAELPSNFETPSSDQFVHTTWTTTVSGGKRVRNYTYCYDTRRHNPVWVAYPHHRCYLEGSGRSNEPWAADPALPESQQAKIYPSSAGDVYQYWVADLVTGRYGSGYWSRGHLCMSRERPGKGLEINMQTFRPTNIAPQAAEPSPFGKIWANIEEAVSGGTIPADTLYIVAGCYYENDGWVQKDASNNGALSSLSKDCVMPTHQFKMAVRKKTVQVGKTHSGVHGR